MSNNFRRRAVLKKNDNNNNNKLYLRVYLRSIYVIGHFRVPPGLCFKTRVGAQPLIWKSFFILKQVKLIFTRNVVHLASF